MFRLGTLSPQQVIADNFIEFIAFPGGFNPLG
jgi:hypothetical protein